MDTGVRNTVKFRTASLVLTLGIVACGALSLAAQKKAAETSGAVVFAQDKAKLTIKLGGQTVGHEEFEIAPSGGSWLAEGRAGTHPAARTASKRSRHPACRKELRSGWFCRVWTSGRTDRRGIDPPPHWAANLVGQAPA